MPKSRSVKEKIRDEVAFGKGKLKEGIEAFKSGRKRDKKMFGKK